MTPVSTKPLVRAAPTCARDASGHAATAPPRRLMNSRRRISTPKVSGQHCIGLNEDVDSAQTGHQKPLPRCTTNGRRPRRSQWALPNSENSKANRIETMKGPAESGQICSVGRRKIAKKIAKNKRCYGNTLRPRSRMLLKGDEGGLG